MLVVEYDVDVAELARQAVRYGPPFRRARRTMLLCGTVVGLVGVVLLQRGNIGAGGGLLLWGLVLIAMTSPPCHAALVARKLRRTGYDGEANRYELDGDGIRVDSPNASSRLDWSAFEGWVTAGDAGALLVLRGGNNVQWLPRSGLVAPHGWDDLTTILDTHLPRA